MKLHLASVRRIRVGFKTAAIGAAAQFGSASVRANRLIERPQFLRLASSLACTWRSVPLPSFDSAPAKAAATETTSPWGGAGKATFVAAFAISVHWTGLILPRITTSRTLTTLLLLLSG